MPTLRHLEIFVEVATCGKMNEAAQNLYLTQPTVSQSISELEGYFNTLLFERLSKKLYLTPAGKMLLPYAQDVLKSYTRMTDFMNGISGCSILKIGASATAGNYYINRLIDEFHEQFPHIQTEVSILGSKYLMSELQNGHLDIALLESDLKNKDITILPAMTDTLHIVCGREHPFFQKDSVTIQDLDGQSFVLRENSSGSRRMLLDFLTANKLTYHTNWMCNNTDALKAAVIKNRGLSLISDTLILQECAAGTMKRLLIEETSFKRDIYLAHHKDKYISKPLKAWIHLCQTMTF